MSRARAADGTFLINGTVYSYRTINRAGRVNPIDVSNSEGIPGDENGVTAPGFASALPDIRSSEITVSEAMFVDETNVYAAPILLVEGGYYELIFDPTTQAQNVASGKYLCVEVSEQGTVGQGALIPSARFRSDTLYSNPGEP